MEQNSYLLLLVEDNPHIMNINSSALQMRGYRVLCAETLAQAKNFLTFHSVDLIVLDVMLPDGSGIDFCAQLRENQKIPVLFLSALGESADVVAGLRAGGDDYLAKPYDLEVLIARIEVRLRSLPPVQPCVRFGVLRLDPLSSIAYLGEEDMLLTQKEFSILLLLARSKGRYVAKEELYQKVWGQPMAADGTALWTVVSRLKKKLQTPQTGISICSSRAEGYALEQQ